MLFRNGLVYPKFRVLIGSGLPNIGHAAKPFGIRFGALWEKRRLEANTSTSIRII